MKLLVISNANEGDELFHNDFGSWNVTRAKRDCEAGQHSLYAEDVEAVYKHTSNVEYDEKKVLDLMKVEEFEPLIAIIEDNKIWLIDGRHRLEALHRLGREELAMYVIEEKDGTPYRVFYNGKRKPPFRPY